MKEKLLYQIFIIGTWSIKWQKNPVEIVCLNYKHKCDEVELISLEIFDCVYYNHETKANLCLIAASSIVGENLFLKCFIFFSVSL